MGASTMASMTTCGAIGRYRVIRAGFAALFAGALLLGSAGQAAAYQEGVVRAAPPAARVEVNRGAPSPHHFWVGGHWGYRPHVGYAWNGGYWAAPRPGYRWQGAHWAPRGGGWHFAPGHWRR
jgi:hypothetical protein